MNQQNIIMELEKKLSLEGLPEETRAIIIARLGENILERTMLSIAEILTEEEAQKVTEMQEQGLLTEVIDFIYLHHPELEERVLVVTNEVIDEFLSA